MPDDRPPTYHPPPYDRNDSHDPAAPSPSYELDDLSLGAPPPARPHTHPLPLPTSSSPSVQSALALDEATIEGCAPKKPPRKPLIPLWIFHSRKGKAFVAVVLLLLAGLVGAMIWYGVDRSRAKRASSLSRVDSYMDVARGTVLPEVPSGLVPYDYDLISPFNFTSPLSSQILQPNKAGTLTNYTVFSSTLHQPLHLDPTTFYYVKVFGSRSSKVTFVPAALDDSEEDMIVNVTAIWRGVEGWSAEESAAWGVNELGLVSGGLHGSNWTGLGSGGTKGVALITSSSNISDESYQPSDLATPFDFLPDWNNTLVFNITVTVPLSLDAYTLSVFGQSAMAVEFGDFTQTNTTFFDVDVRVPKGSISSSGGFNTSYSLSLFSGLPILGKCTVSESLRFISNSTIKTKLVVLPISLNSTLNGTYAATHNLTFLQLNPLSSSLLQANITSFPAHANLSLTALSLNGTIGVQLPIDVYEGSVKLGSNEGRNSGRVWSTFVSWVNSTAYLQLPNTMSFEQEYEDQEAGTGTAWAEGEVVWRGEGGKEVGKGMGEMVMMTDEGTVFVGAGTDHWPY